MEPRDKAPDYKVGYGKPPRHAQFKKGQSGNPKGRPRGAKNVATILEQALDERIMISENGRKRSATKMEVIVKQLVNKAAQGDHRSIQLLIAYAEKHQASKTEERPPNMRDLLELIDPILNDPNFVQPPPLFSVSRDVLPGPKSHSEPDDGGSHDAAMDGGRS
jgi:Family of unknown function (DUF5681)